MSDVHFDKVRLLLHLDNVAGPRTAIDCSNSRNFVKANGNVTIGGVGKFQGGASFVASGGNTYLALGDDPDRNFGGGDFTVELWFKTSSDRSNETLMCNGLLGQLAQQIPMSQTTTTSELLTKHQIYNKCWIS